MPDATITAGEILEQVRAVIEAGETTQPIAHGGPDTPGPVAPTDHYIPFVLYRRIDPAQPPQPGMLPLQAATTVLIGDFRLQLQKRGIRAGDCRPLAPGLLDGAPGPQLRDILYFRLGAWTFAALIAEDPARDCWALGLGVGVDPDAVPDAD